jgi:hypothetical protein
MALRLTTLRPPQVGIDYRAKRSRLYAFVLIGLRSRAVPSSLDAGAASTGGIQEVVVVWSRSGAALERHTFMGPGIADDAAQIGQDSGRSPDMETLCGLLDSL